MKKLSLVLVALMGLIPVAALAHGPGGHPADPNLHVGNEHSECYVKFAPELSQDAYRRFVREFGSVSAFKLMSGPRTLGKRGFAIGVEQMAFTVEEQDAAWNDTFAHPDAYHELGSDIEIPKVRLSVGVSDRLDLGAYWTKSPDANFGWLGLDAKYAMLRQSETMPISLAVRGAYTKTLYVEDMDMHALTADVSAGRTFWNALTPYVGLGSDLVYARERSDVVDLNTETQFVPSVMGGVELRVWHVGIGAEVHRGDLTTFQMQVLAVF